MNKNSSRNNSVCVHINSFIEPVNGTDQSQLPGIVRYLS